MELGVDIGKVEKMKEPLMICIPCLKAIMEVKCGEELGLLTAQSSYYVDPQTFYPNVMD